MPKIEAAIKHVIVRGARREARNATGPLRRDLQRLRKHVAQLRQTIKALNEVAGQWQRVSRAGGWKPQVSEDELKTARLSPRLIQKLRARLALSQAGLARLLKISSMSVLSWEHGRTEPAEQNRKALVALRKLGRRDVKRLLSTLPKPASSSRRSANRRKRGGNAKWRTRKAAVRPRRPRSQQRRRSNR